MAAPSAPAEARRIVLAFDARNRLALRRAGGRLHLPFAGSPEATGRTLAAACAEHLEPRDFFTLPADPDGGAATVGFTQVRGAEPALEFFSLEELAARPAELAAPLPAVLARLDPFLIEIPYLHLGANDYIYKFRLERDRNRAIYAQDPAASALYQSRLCEAIKVLARTHERSAGAPALLDFGAVRYVIPSHFGFCLGVKNAIERAYETLAENPGRRVFMLSELIHNPFVNDDLRRRGLRYLQTDKGVPLTCSGRPADGPPGEPLLWDTLTAEDIVIIPAFGATDEDKRRLVRKGLRVADYDATCMLVEKVWKAARAFGREGFTVVIHGKSEHEETKATFSNSRRHAPSLIVRNLGEARLLGDYIAAPSPARRAALLERFGPVATPGFDPDRDLARLAVVNQTTLLMNETAEIIDHLRGALVARHGPAEGAARLGGGGRRDTLCYATQVNQDALARALTLPLDAACIIGGRNSSNTYQLYRVCAERLGARAHFIQSEANLVSRTTVEHCIFPAASPADRARTEIRPLWPDGEERVRQVLITGGASCPDGLVQQVIARLNAFFPPEQLRPIEAVLADLAEPPSAT